MPGSESRTSPAPGRPDGEPMVSARGLVKRFGDFVAVDAIDFEIGRGESYGLLGPNGAGKTSTMRMIACMSPVTAGDPARARHGPGRRRGRASAAASGSSPRRTRSTSSSPSSTT